MYIRKHTTQPQYTAPIDYEGLGKGMQLLFNPAHGALDSVTKRVWTIGGDVTETLSSRGKVYNYPGVAGSLGYTGYPEMTGTTGTFFIWCPTTGASDDFGHMMFGDASCYFLYHSSGVFYNRGTPSNIGIGWINSTNRSLVASSSGSTGAGLKLYNNGIDTGATFAGSPVAWEVGSRALTLGKYVGGVVHDFRGTILIAGHTTAVWGEAEARAFHDNPWQILKYPVKRRRFVVSIGGNTYTISPSGSITLSGTVSTIKTKIFLPTGDVSFSGNSDVIKGKIIIPQGSIALSGNSPVVKTKIVNSSGTISFSGTSPVIRSKIIEASGGVTFSGTASLSGAVSYIITPEGGTTFTGSSILIKTHIQIPTGKISFSGSSPIESNTVIITVSTRLPLTGVGK